MNAGSWNILIAYFSHSGNTRYMAGQIHDGIGGYMFEIKTVNPYPEDYDSVVDQAKREQNDDYRPQLATGTPNLKSEEYARASALRASPLFRPASARD